MYNHKLHNHKPVFKAAFASLLLLSVLLLASCGGGSTASTTEHISLLVDASRASTPIVEPEKIVGSEIVNSKRTINVGYIELFAIPDSTAAYEGMRDRIHEKKLENRIRLTHRTAAGSMDALNTILEEYRTGDYDVIVPILTPPAQAAAELFDGEKPIIFSSVVDPVFTRLMPNLDTVDPRISATGVANAIPADLILGTAERLTPSDGKKILILYNTTQTNAVSTKEDAKAYAESAGIPYDVQSYSSMGEFLALGGTISNEYAYVYVALDSSVISNFTGFSSALASRGIPLYGATDAMARVDYGVLCTYALDYHEIGQMTADMIIEWYNGTPLRDLPCERYDDFRLVINQETAETLGVSIPQDLASQAEFV